MATITKTLKTVTFTAKAPTKPLAKQETFYCPPEQETVYCSPKQETVYCPPKQETVYCPPDCKCRDLAPICPPGCSCKSRSSKTSKMIFSALGVIIAMLAAYLMVSTDSKVYLIFWVAYSVLRRMIVKTTLTSLKSKTD